MSDEQIEHDDIEWMAPVSMRVINALRHVMTCLMDSDLPEPEAYMDEAALLAGWVELATNTPWEERYEP